MLAANANDTVISFRTLGSRLREDQASSSCRNVRGTAVATSEIRNRSESGPGGVGCNCRLDVSVDTQRNEQ